MSLDLAVGDQCDHFTKLLPSPSEIVFFKSHGWYVTRPLFSRNVLDTAEAGADRALANDHDFALPSVFGGVTKGGKAKRVVTVNYASLRNHEFVPLVRSPIIGAIASQLLGTPVVRLWRDSLIHKPAHEQGGRVGWHSDCSYWKTCSSDCMITAWIPFRSTNRRNGTLTVFDGSHRWDGVDDFPHFDNTDHRGVERLIRRRSLRIKKVSLELRRGQVSFHHCRLIHGSPANLSNRPRTALAVHLQDQSNRYCCHVLPSGALCAHTNDVVCRPLPNGLPDYADPFICPVLWSY